MPALAAVAVAARVALARLRLLAAAAAARLRPLAPRDARADAAADRAPCTRVHGWWTGEQTIHNSQWSVRCARRARLRPSLAYWAYFALLRPQGARFVRPPPLPSSIRNGRSASSHRPRLRRCGVPWLRTALRFVCSPLQPFGPPMCGPPLLIGLTTACFRHRRRPSCAPLQFPLKSYGFPGAETARKRFLLWKMGFSAAKIAPPPPYTPPGTIEVRKGFAPLFGSSTV